MKWSSNEIHSTRVLLQLELLKTLFNAGFPKCLPAYTRLQLIAESFRPIDFHETDARLYYRHAQLERLLVTRFFPFFSSFFQLGKYSFDFPVTSPLLPRSIPDILSNSLLFGTIATFRLSLCQILNLLLKNKLH